MLLALIVSIMVSVVSNDISQISKCVKEKSETQYCKDKTKNHFRRINYPYAMWKYYWKTRNASHR